MITPRPPRWAEALVARTLERQDQEFALGDLAEEHAERRQRTGRMSAYGWYGAHAVSAVLRRMFGGGGSRHDPPGGRAGKDRSRNLLAEAIHDVRHCVRGLAKNPGFTAAAIITLALGIGATTAVFSFADGNLFRIVPGVNDPDDLALVSSCVPDSQSRCIHGGVPYSSLNTIQTRLEHIVGLAAYTSARDADVTVGDDVSLGLDPLYVVGGYFDVLGAVPVVGRFFTHEDQAPASEPVVVISHRLWRALFGGAPDVLDRELLINERRVAVVGVAPRGFGGVGLGSEDLWLPVSTMRWINRSSSDRGMDPDESFGYLVARRHDDASWQQVEAELDSFGLWLAEAYTSENARSQGVQFRVSSGVGDAPPQAIPVFTALFAVAGLILLIACSNVAGLLLIKGLRRRGEMAVRKALGASRWRIVRQYLTESVILWLLGGAAGVFLCYGITRFVEWQAPVSDVELRMNVFVMTFAGCLSLVVGLAFGALPALHAARLDAARWMGQATSMSSGKRRRVRSLLSVAQLGATLTLLVGALLMARALNSLYSVDLGFLPDDVTVFSVRLGEERFDDALRVLYYREITDRLRAGKSVVEVATARSVPLDGRGGVTTSARVLGGGGDELQALATYVGSGYFNVLRIPVVGGRTFVEDEELRGQPGQVAILSETAARGLFGEADPLGKLVDIPLGSNSVREYSVIGIVGDVRGQRGNIAPMVYLPVGGRGDIPPSLSFLVRTSSGAADTGGLIRATATTLDADLPLIGIQAHEDIIGSFYGPAVVMALVTGAMSVLAALLAAVGLYGVIGVFASERTSEFGVRTALGANSAAIFRLVAGETVHVVMPGVLVGLMGGVALGLVLEGFLYGVSPLDPLSWVLAVVALAGVVTVATILPARRATRVDPIEALRSS